jgi:hypothetical protein
MRFSFRFQVWTCGARSREYTAVPLIEPVPLLVVAAGIPYIAIPSAHLRGIQNPLKSDRCQLFPREYALYRSTQVLIFLLTAFGDGA